MVSRRRFLTISLAGLAAGATSMRIAAQSGSATAPYTANLPLVVAATPTPIPQPTQIPTATPEPTAIPEPTVTPEPTATVPIGDAAILGWASGSVEQAANWVAARCDASYSAYDVRTIVEAYQRHGDSVGIDWFVAIAQMAHETGHLTSFWSFRPQRNPAGIGVTGQWQSDPPANTDGWAYNTQRNRWERGISFPTWADHAVPAHLGRLLAYALTDAQANQIQRDMIAYALSYRGISVANRGVAPTWQGLNGRWAVPGTTYGQTILSLAARMRA
ncbi:MAG: hypothetical protein Fur005_34480 [Roseiflexaceae bacterium]